jgi:hypothetical protein
LLFAKPCVAQQPDTVRADTTATTIINNNNNYQYDDDFDMILMIVGFVGVSVMAGIAIITVFIVGGALICVGALIAVGALSVSVGVGIYNRSFSSGVKTAAYICSSILGVAGGSILGWFVRKLFRAHVNNTTALLTGATAGLLGGIIGAACLIWLIRRLFKQFVAYKNKINTN